MRLNSLVVVLVGCGGSTPGMVEPAPDAAPVTAPANTWTWVEVPGSTCGNGSPAGFAINPPATPSTGVSVYFQGGGACWDGPSCFVQKTAVNIEVTLDGAKLAAELNATPADRSAANPFATATLVMVPYCTGDLHAGMTVMDYPVDAATRTVHHTGGTNTQKFVAALHATVPDATTVWLSGSSAGGYGATFNLHRFADAWPGAGVHLLQDSSPFVPVLTNYSTWQTSWSLEFPAGCTECATNLPAAIDAVSAAHPTSRIGLLTFDDDAVVKAYFGYTGSMVPATNMLLANQYDLASTHAFVVAGNSHTMIGQLGTLVGPGGVHLIDWVTQWATGDAAWTTVRP